MRIVIETSSIYQDNDDDEKMRVLSYLNFSAFGRSKFFSLIGRFLLEIEDNHLRAFFSCVFAVNKIIFEVHPFNRPPTIRIDRVQHRM